MHNQQMDYGVTLVQIASYADLEEAMETGTGPGVAVLEKFNTQNKHEKFNTQNKHKMEPIPTFKL